MAAGNASGAGRRAQGEPLSRLSPLRREDLSPPRQQAYDALVEGQRRGANLAGVDGPGGIWLRLGAPGDAMLAANQALRRDPDLDPRDAELAILATARELHCDFIWAVHEPVARRAGVPEAQIAAVHDRRPLRPPAHESEHEQTVAAIAAVALAREALSGKGVSDEAYAAARAAFGEEKLLKLAALIAHYAATAIMLAVADQRLPP